jgi:hypothetical protein
VASRPARAPQGKRAWDAPVSQAEVQATCLHLAVVLSRAFGSAATWESEEFADLARGFVGLSNRVPFLRLLVVLASPLSVIGEILEKARKLKAGIAPKGARGRPSAAAPSGEQRGVA